MNDYIRRADAIQALVGITAYNSVEEIQAACFDSYARANGWLGGVMESIAALAEGVPAAAVRPVVRGEWIPETDRHYHWHCSECGYVIGAMRMDADFCLKCGADMTGGADNA